MCECKKIEDISMKQLTLKTLALVAITSSDRAQKIRMANITEMEIGDNKIIFHIRDQRQKQTRKVLKPTTISCVSAPCEALDVKKYVLGYLEKSKSFRDPSDSQLFLSWVTKKPVSKQTISRWLKIVLHEAGIDTSIFKAHSYRGAGLSKAYKKGASVSEIGLTKGCSKFIIMPLLSK